MVNRKTEVLAMVVARGGSTGIPRKNIKKINRKPLIQYTFDAARRAKLINRIVLSTDDKTIASLAKRSAIEVPYLRPKFLAKNTTPMVPVLQHMVNFLYKKEKYMPDIIVLLQPTSPLRRARHIDEAIELMLDNDADSVISVCKASTKINPYALLALYKGKLRFFMAQAEKITRRQDLPRLYYRNGAIYCIKRKLLMKKNTLYGRNTIPYFMPERESLNIDSKIDFLFAEFLMKAK